MPVWFNSILNGAGIDPASVRLLRHQDNRADRDRTPYRLWRNNPAEFIAYQSRQSARRVGLFGSAAFWAVFVRAPSRENLFAGLYKVGASEPAEKGIPSIAAPGTLEMGDDVIFDLTKSDALGEYEGKLTIDWGPGALAWVQYAHKHDKPVTAIYPTRSDPDFPGYLNLITTLSDVLGLYPAWVERLKETKGVYVLTCLRTKELYVGSATGAGGFYERWMQHAAKGGDAAKFRARDPEEYQVAILEVAGSGATDRDIVRSEHRWMAKLRTNEMGLNGGALASSKPRGEVAT